MHQSPRARYVHARAMLAVLFLVICRVSATQAEQQRYVSGFVGTLTKNRWHDALRPQQVEFADSYMIGGALGWDRRIGASRFRYGIEAQLAAHFGRQDHLELSVPVVLRYVPDQGAPLRSVGAGLGLSYASQVPQVEIDRNGASQRFFVHWMAEIEFATPDPDRTAFLRVHHRSDGYGVFEVDAGSTGFVLGLRHRF
ncbi:hypothetical protein [uncultured Tateyamaria sp.]|uniref:hypothetical protein n=1 Tax=uncultured Tateyamaria sp. TaxID=455651 RepID=UPI002630E0A5|nr:hypothetical protein [uncultured Tateyamaria sp.]